MSRAYKFNPGFQSDDEAVANFIVRQAEFEAILKAFGGEGPPRVLVVAPRGAGKTTLCRRVLAETRRTGRLTADWHAIFLGEESYVVTTPGEFFLECLFQLRDQTPEAVSEAEYAAAVAADDETTLVHATLTALRAYAAKSGRRLLVIVENFHIILNDQIGAQAKDLLALLADDTVFGVLATSVAQAFGDENQHNYLPRDYLQLTLQPLSLEECHTLWETLTDQTVRQERIRPLQILTGGSPRLLHILAEFMRTPSLQDLMGNLNLLIDQNTEYFKSQLDALPAVERKVFAALLDAWDPRTAKQISETARVNTNIASAMLARLSDRGAVVKAAGDGRAAIYYAAERLFNIYYLMRRRSHPSNRVRALVSFMTEYYDQDELVTTTALLVREACRVQPEQRGDYHSTFNAILSGAKDEVRRKILNQTPSEFIQSFRRDHALQTPADYDLTSQPSSPSNSELEAAEIIKNIEAATDRGDFPEALRLLDAFTKRNPDSPEGWLRTSLVQQRLDEHEAAIGTARRATKLAPDDAWSWAVLGRALAGAGNAEEAEVALVEALRLDPAQVMAVVILGDIRSEAGDVDGAVEIYQAARAAGVLPDFVWVRFALVLEEAERSEELEDVLRAGATESLENFRTRRMLVDHLDSTDREEEAIGILSAAADSLQTWESWADLGSYLHSQTELQDKARTALERALDLGADHPGPFRQLGHVLMMMDAPPEEIRLLAERAVESIEDKPVAWNLAGQMYADVGDRTASEHAYRIAMELSEGVRGRLGLARLLSATVERRPEAQALLREAIAAPSNSGVCAAARDLAELLVHEGDELAAEGVVQQALEKNADCICCLLLHGQICARRGDSATAIERYDAALSLNDESIKALTGLALLDPERANDLISRAISIAPDDARTLYTRAVLGGDTDAQISDLRAALDSDPTFIPAALMLAPLEAGQGELGPALHLIETALDRLMDQRELLGEIVAASMQLAQLGHAHEVGELLANHEAGASLEPLIVALQLAQGERPRVANEVMEVAKDILKNVGHPNTPTLRSSPERA